MDTKKQKADSIFRNGRIYTSDAKNRWATAFAVKGDKILAVACDEGIREYIGEDTQVTDLRGKIVIPGFIDMHGHPVRTVMRDFALFFSRHLSVNQMVESIKKFIKDNAHLTKYIGVGYHENRFTDIADIRGFLDEIEAERPLVLLSNAGSELLMNSKAVERSGIDNMVIGHIPKVEAVLKDELGRSTGRVMGMDSVQEVLGNLKIFELEEVADRIESLDEEYFRRGFTGVYDCGSYEYVDYTYFMAIKRYWAAKELRHRFFGTVLVTTLKGAKLANRKLTHKRTMANELEANVGINALRIKYDIVGAEKDLTREAVRILCIEAANKGFNVQFDTVSRESTEELVRLIRDIRTVGFNKIRFSLSSGEITDKEQIKAISENQIIVNSSLLWNKSDIKGEIDTLKEMKAEGVTLTFGLDLGAYDDKEKNDVRACFEELGFTAYDIVDAFTVNAARQLNMEDRIGSISAGKIADFVMLDDDIFEKDAFDVTEVKAGKVFVSGKCVYSI